AAREELVDLPGEVAQRGDLHTLEPDGDTPAAAPIDTRNALSCPIVAQRPCAWSRATSISAFSRVPCDTTDLPSWCTSSISFVAFSREYPNTCWNTYTTSL